MIDATLMFQIIYALAAQDGREEALFGTCMPEAIRAFEQSKPTDAFPELWFELPLMGDPWFDLHALTDRADLAPTMSFDARTTGGHPEAFAWFAAQEVGVRQLALSWDVSTVGAQTPAVQLLVNRTDPRITCGFLDAVGRHDAAEAYCTFLKRVQNDWFVCYTGAFPNRPGHHLRVECIPSRELQRAYAKDPALIEEHLRNAGLDELGTTLIERTQLMAAMPFPIEFQFDVLPDGCAGSTVGVSLRFAAPSQVSDSWHMFDPDAAAGDLMRLVESWGLSDGRWRLLAHTAFVKSVSGQGGKCKLWCLPTFLKLRWRDGEAFDAKAYLKAGVM